MKHKLENSELVIVCEEDLLSTNVDVCIKQAKEALSKAADASKLVVNLEAVNTVDSQGLNFLVGLYQESRSLDWSFSVVGASPTLVQLFKFVKLDERFGVNA